ncbi:MAG: flagellar basal body-associated FliL family protein [Spirochaetota bacterium]|jgi:flagellar FliL protein|nr:flagellar basal body-associated FliL family protein [Spirochaetota bacterium]
MPDDEDFGGFDDEGGADSGSTESSDSGGGGGGLKRFLSGAVLKILLYVAAAIVVVIISVITASVVADGKESDTAEIKDRQGMEQRPPAYAIFEMDEFMTGLADIDTTHFVKLKLSLAYEGPNMRLQSELSDRRRQIEDLILLTLNSKVAEDLHTKGQKEEFKEELVKLINGLLREGEIKNVYFKDFMVN